MYINLNKHFYYDVGEYITFRLSQRNCQNLLLALVASQGLIHDSISFSFDRDGKLMAGAKPGSADAYIRISMPSGNEAIFDSYMGGCYRTDPPEFHLN